MYRTDDAATFLQFSGTVIPLSAAPPSSGALLRYNGTDIEGVTGSVQGSVLRWDPASSSFLDTVRAAAIATTRTIGIAQQNTTPATAGVPVQWSQSFSQSGTGWDTDDNVSRTEQWCWEVQPASGATVTSYLVFSRRQDAGASANAATLSNAGTLVVSNITCAGYLTGSVYTTGAYFRTVNEGTGLGVSCGISCNSSSNPLVFSHSGRPDAANNIVLASVYDRNAAAIANAATMRLHSFGWANNADVYGELAAVYCDGRVEGKGLTAAGDVGGKATCITFSNVEVAAGAVGAPTFINPPNAVAQRGWAKFYDTNGIARVFPFWDAA